MQRGFLISNMKGGTSTPLALSQFNEREECLSLSVFQCFPVLPFTFLDTLPDPLVANVSADLTVLFKKQVDRFHLTSYSVLSITDGGGRKVTGSIWSWFE